MKTAWLIVDGYSLIHRDKRLSRYLSSDGLVVARQHVIRDLEDYAAEMTDRITVVFDGRHKEPGEDFQSSIVEILYSPAHLTADSVIERMVQGHAKPHNILVITSDFAERDTVEAAGARSSSCEQYLELKKRRNDRLSPKRGQKDIQNPTLGDFFPE